MLYPPRSTWSWEAQFCNLLQNPSRRRRVVAVVQSSSPHQLVWWRRLQMGYSSGIHKMLHIRRKDATAEWNKECSSSSWQSKECTIRANSLSVFPHLVQAPFCLPTSRSSSVLSSHDPFSLIQAPSSILYEKPFCFPTSPSSSFKLLVWKAFSVFPHPLSSSFSLSFVWKSFLLFSRISLKLRL